MFITYYMHGLGPLKMTKNTRFSVELGGVLTLGDNGMCSNSKRLVEFPVVK